MADGPAPLRTAFRAALAHRDVLGFSLRCLRREVCRGCELGPRGLRDDTLPGLHLCEKRLAVLDDQLRPPLAPADLTDTARLRGLDDEALRALGRLPYPFVHRRGDQGFTRSSWSEALALVGPRLAEAPPERQAWLTAPAEVTNEALWVLARTAEQLGSPNLDSTARLGKSAAIAGLERTIGVRAATCSLADLTRTDLIVLWGSNPATTHPDALRTLRHARRAGARIVAVDPARVSGLPVDDLVQVAPGGDGALLTALLRQLVEWGALDTTYLGAHTTGWASRATPLQAHSGRTLTRASGVRINELEWLAHV